jgi:hypothetical protein
MRQGVIDNKRSAQRCISSFSSSSSSFFQSFLFSRLILLRLLFLHACICAFTRQVSLASTSNLNSSACSDWPSDEAAAACDASLTPLHELVAAGGRAPGRVKDTQLAVWLHDRKRSGRAGGIDLSGIANDAKAAKELAGKAAAENALGTSGGQAVRPCRLTLSNPR